MEKRYIREERYKKVPRNGERRKRLKKTNLKNGQKNIQKKKISNKRKNKVKVNKFVRFLFCAVIVILIMIITRVVSLEENESFISVFKKNEVEANSETITIAIYDNVSIGTDNVVISELEKYIYPMLLRTEIDYSIKYELIYNVNKISSKEYEITLKDESSITAVDVKECIDKIISDKSKYYYKVENVQNVEIKSKNTLKIYLKTEDDYYIYNLEIPIYKIDDKFGIYTIDGTSDESKLILNRKDSANNQYVKQINIIKLLNEDDAIEMYKGNKIDAFFTGSKNSIKMLGKYEYDIKSYSSGEGIFLLFNPNSNFCKEKYIRQAIAYSIDRENILAEVINNQGIIIDLPYIYDEQKYKYDIYAADNMLLSNGYKKQNQYYIKSGNKLTLELLVNKDDEEKVSIANIIKKDLLKVGISINVNSLSEGEIEKRKNNGDYDIVLASVYMNESPNISHLYSNLILSSEMEKSIKQINEDSLNNLKSNIQNLKTSMSDNVSIYGIYSKNNYIIYRKGLSLFKNINYMNLFGEYFSN